MNGTFLATRATQQLLIWSKDSRTLSVKQEEKRKGKFGSQSGDKRHRSRESQCGAALATIIPSVPGAACRRERRREADRGKICMMDRIKLINAPLCLALFLSDRFNKSSVAEHEMGKKKPQEGFSSHDDMYGEERKGTQTLPQILWLKNCWAEQFPKTQQVRQKRTKYDGNKIKSVWFWLTGPNFRLSQTF